MEEYEVDLRDYLRVIWERKWIIVGVLLAAVLAAVAYSYSLPDEFEAQALVRLEQRPPVSDVSLELPTPKTILEMMKQPEIWLQSLQLFPTEPGKSAPQDPVQRAKELSQGFSADILGDSPFLSLSLRGTGAPEELKDLLARHIVATQTLLREQIRQEVQQKISALEDQEKFYQQQRAEFLSALQKWIDSRLTSLHTQKAELLKQLEDLLAKQNESGDTNLQGEILQQSYAALVAQLQAVESEIIRLQTERQSQYPRPGSGIDEQLMQIDKALQDLVFRKNAYQQVLEMDWVPFRTMGEVRASALPVGPPRALNLAVSGVLGLFVGILLAFFVNYLQSEPIRPEPEPQQPVSHKGDVA